MGSNKRLERLGFCMTLVIDSDDVACGDDKIKQFN